MEINSEKIARFIVFIWLVLGAILLPFSIYHFSVMVVNIVRGYFFLY